MPDERSYSSFLLRVWRSGTAAAPRWHVSLEDTLTGERRGFASLAQMVTFLEQPGAVEATRLMLEIGDDEPDDRLR